MILGQLRMGARQAKNAPLAVEKRHGRKNRKLLNYNITLQYFKEAPWIFLHPMSSIQKVGKHVLKVLPIWIILYDDF